MTEYPIYYFFYGTLCSPTTLQRIIDLDAEPEIRKAQITGYKLAKWGDYPALIEGTHENMVSGSAYLVRSEAEAQKLAHYETKAYIAIECSISFTDEIDPSSVPGMTFVYAGDATALVEGRFDRKLWRRQMEGNVI